MAAYIVFETGHTFRPSMLYPVYRSVDARRWMMITVSWRNLAFTPLNGRWGGKCNDRHRNMLCADLKTCADEEAAVVWRNYSNTR